MEGISSGEEHGEERDELDDGAEVQVEAEAGLLVYIAAAQVDAQAGRSS